MSGPFLSSFITGSNEEALYIMACFLWCCVSPYEPFFYRKNYIHTLSVRCFFFLDVLFHHLAGAVLSVATMVLLLFYVVWIKEDARAINWSIQPPMWFQEPVRFVICTQACPEASFYAEAQAPPEISCLLPILLN